MEFKDGDKVRVSFREEYKNYVKNTVPAEQLLDFEGVVETGSDAKLIAELMGVDYMVGRPDGDAAGCFADEMTLIEES